MPPKTIIRTPKPKDHLLCPHGCGAERDSIDAMQEHVEAKHPVRRVEGALETLGGEASLPDDIQEDIERVLAGASAARQVVSKDAEMAFIQEFQSGVAWQGKMLPEFITMYRPDGRRVRVNAKRMLEVMMNKHYTLRPPSAEVYEENWFHWRCPVPRCKDRSDICELHGEVGTDSNHGLHSPEFMILHHLQTGNQVHKAFFAINRAKLEAEMSGAFAALIASNDEEERRADHLKEEDARLTRVAAGG